MRIAAFSALVAVVWLTAVLCPRQVAADNQTPNFSSRKIGEHHLGGYGSPWPPFEETTPKRMTYREMQMTIREEGGEEGNPVDCCPTVSEIVEPIGGRNREDMYVQLFREGEHVQHFFESSCRADVLDKPCRFVDRKLSEQSKCVQKWSYTYAIIVNPAAKQQQEGEHRRHHHRQHDFPAFPVNSTGRWTLDYIKVRTGCSCEFTPKPKKKKLAAMKRTRSEVRNKARLLHSRDESSSSEM